MIFFFFFFSSRRRHTRSPGDWSSDVCSSDLAGQAGDLDTTTGTTLSTDEYRYVAGANRDITTPDSLDVTVVDNDAPGVLVLQSGDSTDVIEPTEIVVLGSGFLSQKTSVRFKLEGTIVAGQT